MKFLSLLCGVLGLLLGSGRAAQAQTAAASTPAPTEITTALRSRYAAAHDSLMRRVASIHAQTEIRMGVFKASQGSFGGLHRRVWTYASSSVVNESGSTTPAGLVKRQTIKHRYGIELEKVCYYDAKDRKVLSERYEGNQLTRLELLEYSTTYNSLMAKWIFVRGNYLLHTVRSTTIGKTETNYYASPLATSAPTN